MINQTIRVNSKNFQCNKQQKVSEQSHNKNVHSELMTQLFHNYEQQFIKSIKQIDIKVKAIPTLSNHKKQMAFNDLKTDLTECQKYIKLMETEIATFAAQIKIDYIRKVRQYKKDFDLTRKALYKEEQDYAFQKNKQMLVGAELQDPTPQSHRQKLIKEGQKLSDTTYKLKQTVKVMYQTEDVANNIGIELQDHTHRLIENKKKLTGIRGQLQKSQRLIKRMMLRIRRNKFICFSVLAVILLVGVIILGVHFGNQSASEAAQ